MKAPFALIVCNGSLPSVKHMKRFLKEMPYIVCADGGANKLRTFNVRPHVILGDLDSITRETRRHYRDVPIFHIPDQNSTDLEKALDFLVYKNITRVVLIGATGDRPDHTTANFSILLKYHALLDIMSFDDYCTIQVIQKKFTCAAEFGQPVSLIPLGRCTGITTKGLKYPLRNETLALGVREGSSNEASAKRISITMKTGALLFFKIHPDAV